MSHINDREFFDETDNEFRIKELIKKERYNRVFKYLYNMFFERNKVRITVTEVKEALGIHCHSTTYQTMESFRILNLVVKQAIPGHRGGRGFYAPINKEYWKVAKKELTKKGKDGN